MIVWRQAKLLWNLTLPLLGGVRTLPSFGINRGRPWKARKSSHIDTLVQILCGVDFDVRIFLFQAWSPSSPCGSCSGSARSSSATSSGSSTRRTSKFTYANYDSIDCPRDRQYKLVRFLLNGLSIYAFLNGSKERKPTTIQWLIFIEVEFHHAVGFRHVYFLIEFAQEMHYLQVYKVEYGCPSLAS